MRRPQGENHQGGAEGGPLPPRGVAPFNRTSLNVAAAAMLLRAMLEPSTTEGKRAVEGLKVLLNKPAQQQAESSASRNHAATSRRREEPQCSRQASDGLGQSRASNCPV